jgi:hypothetical protein
MPGARCTRGLVQKSAKYLILRFFWLKTTIFTCFRTHLFANAPILRSLRPPANHRGPFGSAIRSGATSSRHQHRQHHHQRDDHDEGHHLEIGPIGRSHRRFSVCPAWRAGSKSRAKFPPRYWRCSHAPSHIARLIDEIPTDRLRAFFLEFHLDPVWRSRCFETSPIRQGVAE